MKRLIFISLFLTISLYANKKYCTNITDNQRVTSIYLDLSNTNEKKFATNLLSSLQDNFLPHERVQIFTINPTDSSVNLIFNSCAPKLTLKEIKKIKAEGSMSYMFGGNPIETAKEDMSFFTASIKATLVKAYKTNVANEYESKPLIEILYNEASNFEEYPMQRVILYSDMIQNSDEIAQSTPFGKYDITAISKEYKTNFNYANVYIFTAKKKFGISKYNKLALFWKKYFELSNADVKVFNDNLKLPNIKYMKYKKYEGKIFLNNKSYQSQILINYTEKRKVANAWFIINEIDAVPLTGIVKLNKGNISKAQLKIDKLYNSHQMFAGNEKFNLKFKGNKLEGILKLDNTDIYVNDKKIKNPTFKIQMKEK